MKNSWPDIDQYDDEFGGPPRPDYTPLKVALVIVLIAIVGSALIGCGSIKCDLLGSDSLRNECENGVMVRVYSVPTWTPGQNNTLRSLWQSDEAAQYGGLY
jgi:hypothetical protein